MLPSLVPARVGRPSRSAQLQICSYKVAMTVPQHAGRIIVLNGTSSAGKARACRFLLEDLAGHDVLLVEVECSHEQLGLREARRGDRESGLAESQLESVHTACSYDLEVNTRSSPPVELACRVAVRLRANPSLRCHQPHA
ncbi:MAG: hypothetical protein IV092_27060 [Burkholderiaceae bacterium]|nr:hypothetical protein [Burkholderiaceae bacterium]